MGRKALRIRPLLEVSEWKFAEAGNQSLSMLFLQGAKRWSAIDMNGTYARCSVASWFDVFTWELDTHFHFWINKNFSSKHLKAFKMKKLFKFRMMFHEFYDLSKVVRILLIVEILPTLTTFRPCSTHRCVCDHFVFF